MPSYVSVMGEWKPAKEYYINPNAKRGENPVYDGPDRGALEQMKELGIGEGESMGTPYKANQDMMHLARTLGFKTIDEYLQMLNKDPKKLRELQEKKLGAYEEHKNPEVKPGSVFESGGDEMVPGGKMGRKGGFELPQDVPSQRLPK